MHKLFLIIVIAFLIVIVVTQPIDNEVSSNTTRTRPPTTSRTTTTTPAIIINQMGVNNPDGSFNSSYETSNGIKVENSGYMKKIVIPKGQTSDGQTYEEHEEFVLVQSGYYTYPDPDGNLITLHYVADENGFQPRGDHLPIGPA